MSRLRIGVIGCGRIAERHLQAYLRLGGVEPVVADQDIASAEWLARTAGVEWRTDPRSLYEDERCQAIDVCVPTIHHADLVISALQAGKHVFCEKPLCHTLDEGRAIAEAVQQANRVLMVGYLYRFHPAMQFARQVLEQGTIGRPHLGLFRFGGRGEHRAWKHTAEAGGGATLEMMVHALDLVQWLLGRPEGAQTLVRRTLLPERMVDSGLMTVTAEDYAVVRMRAGGSEVLCQSDLTTPSYMNVIEIEGSNGSLLTSILDYMPTMVFCKEARGMFNIGNNIRHFEAVNLFELELGYFVRTIRGEVEPQNDIMASLGMLEVIEEIRRTELLVAP